MTADSSRAGDELAIRPASPGDAPTVAEIWRSGWHDGHTGNVPDELVAVRTDESFETRATERVGDTTVATLGDEVAGFVMIVDDEVEQLYVARDHRGSGVAGALLTAAEELIASNGHATAWLAAATGNARARRFYERSGWTDEGDFYYPAMGPRGPIDVPCHRYTKLVG